jgi:hypothetical protein
VLCNLGYLPSGRSTQEPSSFPTQQVKTSCRSGQVVQSSVLWIRQSTCCNGSSLIRAACAFHDQRNLTKNYSQTRLRLFSISDWVEDNIKYLISCFGVERYIDTNFDESLNNFVEYEMFEKVPLNGDIDDKYYMKQFYADMIEYLDENTLNSYSEDDFIQNSMIVPSIAHLINAYPEIFEPILNNTATPEEVCEKLTDFELEDELTEILIETTLTYCSDLIDKQSSNFALKY